MRRGRNQRPGANAPGRSTLKCVLFGLILLTMVLAHLSIQVAELERDAPRAPKAALRGGAAHDMPEARADAPGALAHQLAPDKDRAAAPPKPPAAAQPPPRSPAPPPAASSPAPPRSAAGNDDAERSARVHVVFSTDCTTHAAGRTVDESFSEAGRGAA